jgi:hypothetical protein
LPFWEIKTFASFLYAEEVFSTVQVGAGGGLLKVYAVNTETGCLASHQE